MSIIVLPKSETLPSDLKGKKAETETLISHFSESIPNLGNERKVTDGVLIGVGNQIFHLAWAASNRLTYLFPLFISFLTLYQKPLWGCTFCADVFENTCMGKEMFWFRLGIVLFFLTVSPCNSPPLLFPWKQLPCGGGCGSLSTSLHIEVRQWENKMWHFNPFARHRGRW